MDVWPTVILVVAALVAFRMLVAQTAGHRKRYQRRREGEIAAEARRVTAAADADELAEEAARVAEAKVEEDAPEAAQG